MPRICIIGHLILVKILICASYTYKPYNSENQKKLSPLFDQPNPEDWGWKLTDSTLEPIQTLLPPAQEKLLNAIFRNCKKGCDAKCGCKKVGLLCLPACINCQGQSCSNAESNTTDEDSYGVDEETADSFSFEQFINIQQEKEEIEEDVTVEIEVEEGESD